MSALAICFNCDSLPILPAKPQTPPTDRAPPGLKVGDAVSLSNGLQAVVTEISDKEVTIDLNPELAGGWFGYVGGFRVD